MSLCKLCLTNEANKTGSHVVPHFLIQSMYNMDGLRGRDKEICLEIGSMAMGRYFGRSVPPEKIIGYLGRDILQEEIESQSNPFVKDNIFCIDCENRLGKIESYYSSKYLNSNPINLELDEILCNSEISKVFWMSVMWRICIAGDSGIEVNENNIEFMRLHLDLVLSNEVDVMLRNIENKRNNTSIISYYLMKGIGLSNESGSVYIASPNFTDNLKVLINEFCIYFYFSDNINIEEFFGFENYIRNNSLNSKFEYERCSKIPENEFRNCLQRVFKLKVEQLDEGHISYFNQLYKAVMSNQPIPDFLLNILMYRLKYEDKNIITYAERYSEQRKIRLVFEEFKHHINSFKRHNK